MLLHATIPLHPLAYTVTTGLFVPFPCLFWHAKHVFEQGKFCMGEIFFGLVAQLPCFPFLHRMECLGDFLRTFQSLQLSEGIKKDDSRLNECFHGFFFSGGILLWNVEGRGGRSHKHEDHETNQKSLPRAKRGECRDG